MEMEKKNILNCTYLIMYHDTEELKWTFGEVTAESWVRMTDVQVSLHFKPTPHSTISENPTRIVGRRWTDSGDLVRAKAEKRHLQEKLCSSRRAISC